MIALILFSQPIFSSVMGASRRSHGKSVRFKQTAKDVNDNMIKQEKELNEYIRAMKYKSTMRSMFGLEKGTLPTIKVDLYHV